MSSFRTGGLREKSGRDADPVELEGRAGEKAADEENPSSRREQARERLRLLSPRQLEVLQHIAQGHRNKQIAHRLGLSEKTVKMHRSILMTRLRTPTTADAIRLAVEAGY